MYHNPKHEQIGGVRLRRFFDWGVKLPAQLSRNRAVLSFNARLPWLSVSAA